MKENKEIKLRYWSAEICDIFEELLEEKDITIPSEDREGEEEARLYGCEYYNTEAEITDLLLKLIAEVKANPDAKIDSEDY